MKLCKGDHVIIKSKRNFPTLSPGFVSGMRDCFGKVTEITEVIGMDKDIRYQIEGSPFWWTEEMFESYITSAHYIPVKMGDLYILVDLERKEAKDKFYLTLEEAENEI